MNKNKNLAFTLAEVLIVIGIIGVVAALTLPNLNHATGDKEKVTKVKKIYAALTDAVDRAQVIYGDFDTWFNDLSTNAEKDERFAKRVTEFMKVSKDCGTTSGCWSENNLFDYAGQSFGDPGHDDYSVLLSDGTSINFYNECHIVIDIDGPNKGKKQVGSDIFYFTVLENQLSPSSQQDAWTGNLLDNNPSEFNYETAWVIENGNLDYLKCFDELDWENKTSCE